MFGWQFSGFISSPACLYGREPELLELMKRHAVRGPPWPHGSKLSGRVFIVDCRLGYAVVVVMVVVAGSLFRIGLERGTPF